VIEEACQTRLAGADLVRSSSHFALVVGHPVDAGGTSQDGHCGGNHEESELGPILWGLLENEARRRLEEVLLEWDPVWAGGKLIEHVDLHSVTVCKKVRKSGRQKRNGW
jgi:hypothetical protein